MAYAKYFYKTNTVLYILISKFDGLMLLHRIQFRHSFTEFQYQYLLYYKEF